MNVAIVQVERRRPRVAFCSALFQITLNLVVHPFCRVEDVVHMHTFAVFSLLDGIVINFKALAETVARLQVRVEDESRGGVAMSARTSAAVSISSASKSICGSS